MADSAIHGRSNGSDGFTLLFFFRLTNLPSSYDPVHVGYVLLPAY